MKWLFRIVLMIYGCRHTWKEIKCISIYETAASEYPHKWQYVLQCKKCGDIKARKI